VNALGRALAIAWLVLVAVLGVATTVQADVVDDEFARGNERAAAGDWDGAIEAWQHARGLLGQPSSVLSYNLGTAHAERGDLGRATFHLRQALDFRGSPTAELAEAARYNLAIVRRRAELQAATTAALVDRPQTWWDLLVETLRAPGVGWTALVCGALWLAIAVEHVRRRLRGKPLAVTRVAMIAFATLYVVAGVLHGLSLRADRTAPRAIVLENRVDAREGPGTHRKVEFAIQGGAQVRIVDRTPGWVLVRLPGGVEGWVGDATVGELESTASVRPLPGPSRARNTDVS
jgi:tetratricopeptide (TPR) repeat protein